jgi:hypothetical protein
MTARRRSSSSACRLPARCSFIFKKRSLDIVRTLR